VWRAAAAAAVPFLALIAFYCLRPREYFTGTNSVEAVAYIAEAQPGQPTCVRGLYIPAGTARIRLQLISRTSTRPALKLTGALGEAGGHTIEDTLPATAIPSDRISAAVFTIPELGAHPSEQPASLCLTASGLVNWAGTPLPSAPATAPASVGGRALAGRIAVWYLPPSGAERSYLSRAATILRRASLFRPGFVGPWLYVLILLVLLPGLALASVRCLALAAGGSARRLGGWLFAIAALNFACWALITPAFQAPDEVDHFAYTQSLVQRGEAPSRNPASPLLRWSSQEVLALEDMSFFTDHQVGDTRVPWTARQQSEYRKAAAAGHPSASNGGGNETAATHGPVYYAALAPAYILASGSPLAQLTLMRLTSALIGALAVLFAFLLGREIFPRRIWPAVLAALLVTYEPMYGFISGAVNNDVGVNAGAAALELLLIRMLRRGLTIRLGLLTGALLAVLPVIKATSYSLYPVAAVTLAVSERAARISGAFHPSEASAPAEAGSVVAGATSEALAHPLGYLGYLWQVFLPRLPFMTRHFHSDHLPAFVIFIERGWGAFGWYDVLFAKWVYAAILLAMLAVAALGVMAARRERALVRRNAFELGVLLLMPVAVIAGFEAAFYTTGSRPVIAEFGRYAFPAIAPLAVLVVASLHAFPRRLMIYPAAALLVAMLALSYSSQLLTMTGFYA
jgi:hypothetical protein